MSGPRRPRNNRQRVEDYYGVHDTGMGSRPAPAAPPAPPTVPPARPQGQIQGPPTRPARVIPPPEVQVAAKNAARAAAGAPPQSGAVPPGAVPPGAVPPEAARPKRDPLTDPLTSETFQGVQPASDTFETGMAGGYGYSASTVPTPGADTTATSFDAGFDQFAPPRFEPPRFEPRADDVWAPPAQDGDTLEAVFAEHHEAAEVLDEPDESYIDVEVVDVDAHEAPVAAEPLDEEPLAGESVAAETAAEETAATETAEPGTIEPDVPETEPDVEVAEPETGVEADDEPEVETVPEGEVAGTEDRATPAQDEDVPPVAVTDAVPDVTASTVVDDAAPAADQAPAQPEPEPADATDAVEDVEAESGAATELHDSPVPDAPLADAPLAEEPVDEEPVDAPTEASAEQAPAAQPLVEELPVETQQAVPAEAEPPSSDSAPPAEPPETPKASPASDQAGGRARTAEALREAMTIDGALGVALVDAQSGMTLDAAGDPEEFDLEVAAAGNSALVRAMGRTLGDIDLDDHIEDILVTLGTQYHIVRPIPAGAEDLFLYLVLDRSQSNLAMARFRLTKLAEQIRL